MSDEKEAASIEVLKSHVVWLKSLITTNDANIMSAERNIGDWIKKNVELKDNIDLVTKHIRKLRELVKADENN